MYPKQLLDTVYDILAQNNRLVQQGDRDHITEHIDHVDYDRNEIVFINDGKEYTLTLMETK